MLWRTLRLSVRQPRRSIGGSLHHASTLNSTSAPELTDPKQQDSATLAQHARLLGEATSYKPHILEQPILIQGLVRSIRKQKKTTFAHLSDGSTLKPVQAILNAEQAKDLANGCYVELVGKWQKSPGEGQSHELQVTEVKHVGASDPMANPVQKQQQTNAYLRTIPQLRMRTPLQSLLTRTRSEMISWTDAYFRHADKKTTYQVHPPLITSSDCEGAGEVFTVSPRATTTPNAGTTKVDDEPYFGSTKYLTVSSQLHLEAYSAALGNVWCLSPTFRAEESDTPRHLAEFYMLEAEYRGVTRLAQVQKVVQNLMHFVLERLSRSSCGKQLAEYYADSDSDERDVLKSRHRAIREKWVLLDYTDVFNELTGAYEQSGGSLFANRPNWNRGLALEHERWAVENLAQNRPLMVSHYPKAIKPFYMLPSNLEEEDDQENPTVACFDVLLPYGFCEVVGGSLREHRLDKLIQNMREKGLLKISPPATDSSSIFSASGSSSRTSSPPPKETDEPPQQKMPYPYLHPSESLGNLQWYADLRRFGSSPHGGFGLGFDRYLAYLTGLHNVRDVVGFPRVWRRADC